MNKRNKLIILVSVLVFVSVVSFSAVYLAEKQKPESVSSHNTVDFPAVSVDPADETLYAVTDENFSTDFSVEIEVINDTYVVDGKTLISKTANCPAIQGDEASFGIINSSLRDFSYKLAKITSADKAEALESYSSDSDIFGFETYEFSADFIYSTYGQYISFLFDCSDYRGGADSEYYKRSVCYDLKNGDRVSLFSVIDKESSNGIFVSKMNELISSDPENYYSDALETVTSMDISDSFYFENGDIFVCIDPGVISPSAFGSLKIKLT